MIQDVIPPLSPDSKFVDPLRREHVHNSSYSIGLPSTGKANTVKDLLHRILPGLFPTTSNDLYSLAVPYLHGVELPPDAEMAWLACCSPGADGWLRIGIRLNE